MPDEPRSDPPACDILLTFADDDEEFAIGVVAAALERAGIGVTYPARFALGRAYLDELERAVLDCRFAVVVLSPAFEADRLSQFQAVVAQHLGLEDVKRRVIPVLYRTLTRPSPLLDALVRLDCRDADRWAAELTRLCDAVGKPLPPSAAPPACPYPGMLPFDHHGADVFFGRRTKIDEIIARMVVENRLLLIGPSGSGKSSLVFAGVIPALARSAMFSGQSWSTRQMRPGADPLTSLAGVLDRRERETDRLLLVIDQLEEVFTVAASGDRDFVAALEEVWDAPNCHVIATMRADFYHDLMSSGLWAPFEHHRVDVQPLSREDLADAIREPALARHVYVEGALVQKLVDDAAAEPGMLPFVQETLRELWNRLEWRLLPLSAYVLPRLSYGEPPRTTLQRALETHANAAVADLDPEGREVAPRIFLRLVQLGEGRQDVRRQRTMRQLEQVAEDPAVVRRTIEALVAARLLTRSSHEGSPAEITVDIAHEALITGWSQLRTWIADLRVAEKVRLRLEDKAAEWERLERRGGLLDQVELEEAVQWAQGREAGLLGVDAGIQALIDASADAEEARRRSEEADRERRLQVTRRWLAGVGVVAVVAIATAVFARFQQRRADDAASETKAVQVAILATQLADRSLDRALLLSVEAQRRRAVPEAEAALVTALARAPALERILRAHDAQVSAVAVAPDGSLIASAGADQDLVIWSAAGAVQRTLEGHSGEVYGLAFSRDGNVLVSSSDDGTIRRWDPRTGAALGNPSTGHTGYVRGIAIDPLGSWIASAGHDTTVRIWELETGRALRTLDGHDDLALDVAVNRDGSLLASAGADGTVIVRRTSDFEPAKELTFDPLVRALAFHPESPSVLAIGLQDGRVAIANLDTTDDPLFLAGHTERVFDVAFSPDGQRVASAGRDQSILVHDVETGELVDTLAAHAGDVRAVTYGRDGTLVSGSRDQTVMIWDPDRTQRLAELPLGPESSVAVAYSPDGGQLLSITGVRELRVLDVDSGQASATNLTSTPTLLAFSPDGATIGIGNEDGSLTLLDAGSMGVKAGPSPVHAREVTALTFDPSGARVATGDGSGALVLWDVADGRVSAQQQLAEFGVVDLAFDGSGEHLLITDDNGTMWSWAITPPDSELRQVVDNRIRARQLALSSDGEQLVVGTGQDEVLVWDLEDGVPSEVVTTLDHVGEIDELTIDATGRIAAAAAQQGTVTLWDLNSGRGLGVLPIPTARMAVVRPGTRTLAVASAAGTQVWDLDFENLIAAACTVANRNLTREEWDFYLGGSYRESCPAEADREPGG